MEKVSCKGLWAGQLQGPLKMTWGGELEKLVQERRAGSDPVWCLLFY